MGIIQSDRDTQESAHGPYWIGTVGYKGSDVSPEYIITIISSQIGVIKALSPDTISMDVTSKWESFLNEILKNNWSKYAEQFSQAAFHVSLQTSLTYRRMWLGTSPVSIPIELRFESEHGDPYNEVVLPVQTLQSMCLPASSKVGLLVPPGPSPFTLFGKQSPVGEVDVISFYVGNFLAFKNVIVESVGITFDGRYSDTYPSYPMSSKVRVTFSTFEILTKNVIPDVYKGYDAGELTRLSQDERRRIAGV